MCDFSGTLTNANLVPVIEIAFPTSLMVADGQCRAVLAIPMEAYFFIRQSGSNKSEEAFVTLMERCLANLPGNRGSSLRLRGEGKRW